MIVVDRVLFRWVIRRITNSFGKRSFASLTCTVQVMIGRTRNSSSRRKRMN